MPHSQMSPLQELVFYRTYSRWSDSKGRRETWEEAVDRYCSFFEKKFEDKVPAKVFRKIRKNIKEHKTMPSMRAFWTAGDALDSSNVAGYNCSYTPISDLRASAEVLYILCCGAGVGFSVENKYVSQIQEVKYQTGDGDGVFVIPDNKEGWADALFHGLDSWYNGKDIEFDYSLIRPRGARLKTMGGRASGPEPLKTLLVFVREKVLSAQGRKLTSLEWLDIQNKIAEIVVVGGVRRSSQISFSDLHDYDIRDAKDFSKGNFPLSRYMSNNSAVYFGRPSAEDFSSEWSHLIKSKSGERGIFNVNSALNTAPRRLNGHEFRTNPCGEIILRPYSFCNLSEVIIRREDTFSSISDKLKSAVWIGAMQACLTDFPYLRPEWKKNCEEERLLGVSLTGQMDHPSLLTEERLHDLKQIAIEEAEKASAALGINMPVAITTGKPSGTVSLLVNSSSGAHARFAEFYIRRVRISATDPLCRMSMDQGVPMVPENGQGPDSVEERRKELMEKGRTADEAKILVPDWDPKDVSTWVLEFPERAPKGAVVVKDVTALSQLEHYKKMKTFWCEHNQSITVYVKESEWMEVGAWVYNNFDIVNGISFLPSDGGKYKLAPYEEISEEVYNDLKQKFPVIDYNQLSRYELSDNTEGAKALACSAGGCELI